MTNFKIIKTSIIGAVVGSIIGVLIVRAFFLDPIQILGWNIFWERIADGELMHPDIAFRSNTFFKCVAGFIIGGIVGAYSGTILIKYFPSSK